MILIQKSSFLTFDCISRSAANLFADRLLRDIEDYFVGREHWDEVVAEGPVAPKEVDQQRLAWQEFCIPCQIYCERFRARQPWP